MSLTTAALTRCNRTGCQQMTPNTFCSRECRRLASVGRPCRRAQTSSGVTGTDENYVSRAELRCVRAAVPADNGYETRNGGKRRWIAAKKRRDEAAERRQRRRKR